MFVLVPRYALLDCSDASERALMIYQIISHNLCQTHDCSVIRQYIAGLISTITSGYESEQQRGRCEATTGCACFGWALCQLEAPLHC